MLEFFEKSRDNRISIAKKHILELFLIILIIMNILNFDKHQGS